MKRQWLALIVLLIPPLAASGEQGVIDLLRTGQTRIASFDGPLTDSVVQAGLPLLPVRFTDNGDGSVTDNMTGLVWSRMANLMASRDPAFDDFDAGGDGYVSWPLALAYATVLNNELYLGFDDWRVPNVVELETLTNHDADSMFDWLRGIDNPVDQSVGVEFPDLRGFLWTSTTVASDMSSAWLFETLPGKPVAMDKATGQAFAWVVRGVASGPFMPWASGQATSFAAGDDGALQMGASALDPRFVEHGDETVTDTLTGLIWTRNANGPGPVPCMPEPDFRALVWHHNDVNPHLYSVQDYVLCLNTISFLGYDDWRLPNLFEMRSLIDHGQSSPALPPGHPFSDVMTYYWTATDYFDDFQSISDLAWIIDLRTGAPLGDNKLISRSVWPVRGGLLGEGDAELTGDGLTGGVSVDFPATPVDLSARRTLSIVNQGPGLTLIGTVEVTSDAAKGGDPTSFSVANDDCSAARLDVAQSCSFDVVLRPASTGPVFATLTVPSSADGSQPRRLVLSAAGLPAERVFIDGFEGEGTP